MIGFKINNLLIGNGGIALALPKASRVVAHVTLPLKRYGMPAQKVRRSADPLA